jgi:glycosyltransferase involved in cell wall biosynthesis
MSVTNKSSFVKIAVLFDQRLTSGGGFQQSLSTILSLCNTSECGFTFVFFSLFADNVEYLRSLGLSAVYLPLPRWRQLVLAIRRLFRWYPVYSYIRMILGPNYIERTFERHNIDLVYFTSPSYLALDLDRLNYLFTLWDLCHIDEPVFPEVRNDGQFELREHLYTNVLPKSAAVLVDSEITKHKVHSYYRVPLSRIHVVPFSASISVRQHALISADCVPFVRTKYNINFDYVFYPAQFWPHKNHSFILDGLKLLEDHYSIKIGAVFAGGSVKVSNQAHIFSQASRLGISDRVRFLGFVPSSDIPCLYLSSIALVMPTYFGPTNIPPLEAFALKVPIVYPNDPELYHHMDLSMLPIDLKDPMTLASVLASLVQNGSTQSRVQNTHSNDCSLSVVDSTPILKDILVGFARRRKCWAR